MNPKRPAANYHFDKNSLFGKVSPVYRRHVYYKHCCQPNKKKTIENTRELKRPTGPVG